MKNSLILILLISVGMGARGQSLERQVIGSGGAYMAASWGSLSATTGEVAVTTLSSSLVLTQGFQQPLPSDVAVYNVQPNNISVKVYPVPASAQINIAITNSGGSNYKVTLFDMPGRQLQLPYQDLSSGTETMYVYDIHSLAAGAYLILVSDEHNQNVKTIKFTKLN